MDGQARYEIRVTGGLDGRWAAWFGGLQISGQGEETVISGLLADQAALHGVLNKVRDLGLCLISVRRLESLVAVIDEDVFDVDVDVDVTATGRSIPARPSVRTLLRELTARVQGR
jgi:hypothetical protein